MRIGIIGCGLIGQKRAKQLRLSNGDKVTSICDVVPDKVHEMNEILGYTPHVTSDYFEVLKRDDVDAAIVATTHNKLASITAAAILFGKHVLVEKPVGMNVNQIKWLIGLCEQEGYRDIVVRVGFNHRYHPAIMQAQKLLLSSEYGRLIHLRCRYGHGGRFGYDREWRANPDLAAGGELVEQGIHVIDLAQQFLGPFSKVEGFCQTEFWDQTLDDNAYLILTTAQKQIAQIHVSCTEWKNKFSLEIFGERGKIEVDGLGGSYGVERCISYLRPEKFGPPYTNIWEYPQEDRSWAVEFEEFKLDIAYNRVPSASLYNALDAWKIISKVEKR